MQFLEASNAVEILRAAGPTGLHVRELAKRIDVLQERNATAGTQHAPLDPGKLGEPPLACALCYPVPDL